MKNLSLALGARLVLGGVFLYAGFVKLGQPLEFALSISGYELLPYFGNIFLASVLPWIELFCGLMLIVGWKVRPTAALMILVMLVFIGALISAKARGLEVDCGCFEVGKADELPPSIWIALVRDFGLLFLSIAVWLSAHRAIIVERDEVSPI